jgi:hypothetical protein
MTNTLQTHSSSNKMLPCWIDCRFTAYNVLRKLARREKQQAEVVLVVQATQEQARALMWHIGEQASALQASLAIKSSALEQVQREHDQVTAQFAKCNAREEGLRRQVCTPPPCHDVSIKHTELWQATESTRSTLTQTRLTLDSSTMNVCR